MIPESSSSVYDLGQHVLEITAARTLLLTAHPTEDGAVPELVQLESEEAYKLLLLLQTLFPCRAE